jgi:hypothetical protein
VEIEFVEITAKHNVNAKDDDELTSTFPIALIQRRKVSNFKSKRDLTKQNAYRPFNRR